MIAVSVIIENFFPPSPSDVFVVLAAFLTHRGTLDPLTIFLVAWSFSVGGAVLVYWASLRYGRRFFASPLGRRLISPGTFATIEKEYVRFGTLGMFVLRVLPAFRSVVAPFSGLVGLSKTRTFVPIVAASGLWFAALTLLGSRLGAEWETIVGSLEKLNTGLGIAAAAAGGLLVVWFLHRRKALRRERLAQMAPFDPENPEQPAPMVDGLPNITAERLEAARRERRESDRSR